MITADTRQLTALAADLARAGVTVQQPVNNELEQGAKAIRDTGRDLVRRLTGATARSISVARRGQGYQVTAGEAGPFLEFGTRKMRAYPFMQPAADRHIPSIPDRVAKAAADNTLTGRSSFIPTSLI